MFARNASVLLLECGGCASQQRALLYSLSWSLQLPLLALASVQKEATSLALFLSPCAQSSEGLREKERKAVAILGADG